MQKSDIHLNRSGGGGLTLTASGYIFEQCYAKTTHNTLFEGNYNYNWINCKKLKQNTYLL
jgi:hypothetical protein